MRHRDYPLKSEIEALSDQQLSLLAEGVLCERLRRRLVPLSNPKESYESHEHKQALVDTLLSASRVALPDLEALLESILEDWNHWDGIYRFYHQSFKVYQLQALTLRIRDALQALMPGRVMNGLFQQVLTAGTGREFHDDDNKTWVAETLPVTAAYLHAKTFLEVAIRCAKTYDHLEQSLPSDLALFLYLFNLR